MATKKKTVRTPVQARAKATVDSLCAAAVRVIEEGGLPAFNTNAVAAEAGVSIQTLYAYFPDKYDILREIFRREQQNFSAVLMPYLEGIGQEEDWRSVVKQALRKSAAFLVADPGILAVRNAMGTVPKMDLLTQAADEELAAALAASLRARTRGLTPKAAANASRMLITMIGAGLERVTASGKVDRALLNELTMAVESSMERVLESPAVTVR